MGDKERGKLIRLGKALTEKPSKRQKPEEEKAEYTSLLVVDGKLWEQVQAGGAASFVRWDAEAGRLESASHVTREGVKVLPLGGEELTLGAIKLPTGAEEYGVSLALLREIEEHIHKYLDVSDAFRRFAAYYVLLSWLYDRFSTLPYLRFLGDTGCGKSRALDVIGGLCYKPIMASGCITPAPIYRMLRRWGGTVILDEADMRNSDEYNEVITILNCGFERGRPVIRATKDNPDKLQFLPTFGPKVFATRQRFQDPALEARCLTEIMSETTRSDIAPVLGKSFVAAESVLRRKLLMFRLRNWHDTDPEAGAQLRFEGLEPRLRQLSTTFAALFANQPTILQDFARFIGGHQRELIEQRAATRTGQIVTAMFELLGSTVTHVTNVTHVTGEPVSRVTAKDIGEKLDLKPQAVAPTLKALGLRTRLVRAGGEVWRGVVLDEAKLAVLRRRYILPDEEDGVTTVTFVTSVTGLHDGSDDGAPTDDEPLRVGEQVNTPQGAGSVWQVFQNEVKVHPDSAGKVAAFRPEEVTRR
ncbi:MAG: hypothetical protein Q8P50_06010 [Bacillota bacterium]|nr:hypothetical protein [Bacillota bacterium]